MIKRFINWLRMLFAKKQEYVMSTPKERKAIRRKEKLSNEQQRIKYFKLIGYTHPYCRNTY